MKWIFKNLFTSVPSRTIGKFGDVEYVIICTGGSFLPEKEDGPMYKLTDRNIINECKNTKIRCLNYLHGYFGGYGDLSPADKGLIGKWTNALDESENLYYFVLDGFVRKMAICEYDEFGLTSVTGHQYIMEYNGNAMDMVPEEGDIIYDNYEEAKQATKLV